MIRSPFKVFLLTLLATWIFFFEYLPPFRHVQLTFDLDGFHLPLFQYGFLSLKHFRLPQWDPGIYSGTSFLGNIQAAFFYPGTWLMYLASLGRQRLSFQAVEDLTLAHVALAFTLCFLWLRNKWLHPMAVLLGSAVFGFSGYMCLQLQHFGLIVAYAWMPLGFLAIDEAGEQKSWRPLWKLALAGAMALLGGYPPSFGVFAISAGTYALARTGRKYTVPGVVAAFAFALALSAVQLLPSWDASRLHEPEVRYAGMKDPMQFMGYVTPNFWDFSMKVPVETNQGKDHFYLGAPGLFGILCALLAWSRWKTIVPALAVIAVTMEFATDPYDLVSHAIEHSPLLYEVLRSYYFLAGTTLGLAELAAQGLDGFLSRKSTQPTPTWMFTPAMVAMFGWAAWDLVRWRSGNFASGWASFGDVGAALAIFALGLWTYCAEANTRRTWVAVALVLFVTVEYKATGTSKRFNTATDAGFVYNDQTFPAMSKAVFQATRGPSDDRILLGELGPPSAAARQVGWSTPQGFDPLLTSAYLKLGTRYGKWDENRLLTIDPLRTDALRVFGVRFVAVGPDAAALPALKANPHFRQLDDDRSYYKVFEYLDAQPIYQFLGPVEVQRRDPEHRTLHVNSTAGGLLTFSESAYPGWSATLDGAPLMIEEWEDAFQAVHVPAGAHTVEFIYRERLLPLGVGISVVSLALLLWWRRAARA